VFDKCSSEHTLTTLRERERDHHVVWDLKASRVITMQRRNPSINSFVQSCHTHMHGPTTTTMLVKCGLHMESTTRLQQRGARGPQLEPSNPMRERALVVLRMLNARTIFMNLH